MKLENFTGGFGRVVSPDVVVPATPDQLKVRQLEKQIEFLLDVFTRRDSNQRAQIDQLENVIMQQAQMITFFKASTTDVGPQ